MSRVQHALTGIALAALVAACGSDPAEPSAGGDDTVSPSPSAGCRPVTGEPSQQQFGREPKLAIKRTTYTATVTTNCGDIVIELDGKAAPHTVNSFVFLAEKHYFDATPCHRLTTSGIFVLQCGDPTGSGTGGPGYTLPEENLKGARYPAGTVAMARTAQPHSGGSQFFLVYEDTELQPDYTPFGTITAGLDVLRRIAAKGSNPPGDGAPVQPVAIESVAITTG